MKKASAFFGMSFSGESRSPGVRLHILALASGFRRETIKVAKTAQPSPSRGEGLKEY